MPSVAPDGNVECSACGETNPPQSRFCGRCGRFLDPGLPKPGEVIADRYRIVAPIGRGAMGTVYRAEHVQISKPVAIKLLHRDLQEDADNVARFHLEAESASRLNHPNTVQVFDFGATASGALYIAMEFVDGKDLGRLIEDEGTLPFGRVAALCAQIAGSVADAHEAGIIHRDLKPENIVVTQGRDGELTKVLDFGLAKLFEPSPRLPLTASGTLVGTPYYMSPEQIRADELDGRSDVYSLGAIMYECVVGSPPFDAPNPVGVLTQHLAQVPPLPSSRSPRSLPPEADAIIMRCLEKEPSNRFESAEAMRNALIDYLSGVGQENWRAVGLGSRESVAEPPPIPSPRKSRRWWIWTTSLLGMALLASVSWYSAARGPLEQEPNERANNANRLDEDVSMKAYLGKRLTPDEGDVDVFAIERGNDGTTQALIDVSAIPNIDIVVELLGPDMRPLWASDARGIGEPERLPNVPLAPGRHFIRVEEKDGQPAGPTENVSDAYFVRWESTEVDAEFEREPNDSLELAESLPPGLERRGWIGWRDDVDVYCLDAAAESVVAQVSGLPGVDLVLRVVDRERDLSKKYDAHRAGRGESSKPSKNARAGTLCVEVSANAGAAGDRAVEPTQTYGVRFIRNAGS